ncbi:DUF4862 family protein [Microcella alkalica]|uniref:DUF4862 family protein n=1 Tax=Microcella alkalica TaxID=355930 RepID=A0A839EAJ2_9MICO|nr:DUF4862 family protein [Microcella alkalica]MBA8848750.1 hypothetical protein [Microcella alkalica]
MPHLVESPGYVVGAYAVSRAHSVWDAREEEALYDRLATDDRIAGLELPWLGRLHPHDDDWLAAHFPERFTGIITSIPGLMSRIAGDPDHGLASMNESGRRAAVAEARRIGEAARRWNDREGRRVVSAVELHAGPRADRADAGALARSLDELARAEWDGAEIVIEHCDAAVAGRPREKGFLGLDAELRALADAPASWGVSLNWGRSALELRDGDRVVEHIVAAREAGRLRGLMFSGAAAEPSAFGDAWTDAHLPLQRSTSAPHGEPTSLLTEEAVGAALDAARAWSWSGVKVGCADRSATLDVRVAIVDEALSALDRAARGRRPRGVAGSLSPEPFEKY